MISAIALVKNYFWPHARAALRQIGLNHRDQNIRHVLRWIKNNEFIKKQQEKVISLRQIRREALSEGIDGEEAHDLIERMVAAGWLKAKPIEKVVGRPRARWIINLLLFKDSAEEAADGETTVAEIAETAKTSDGVTDAELSAVTAILATSKSKKRKT